MERTHRRAPRHQANQALTCIGHIEMSAADAHNGRCFELLSQSERFAMLRPRSRRLRPAPRLSRWTLTYVQSKALCLGRPYTPGHRRRALPSNLSCSCPKTTSKRGRGRYCRACVATRFPRSFASLSPAGRATSRLGETCSRKGKQLQCFPRRPLFQGKRVGQQRAERSGRVLLGA